MTLSDISFLITCVTGFVTFIVYAFTLILQSRHPDSFGGSFYIIYKINCLYNLITFINSFFGLRIPQNTCYNCTFSHIFINSESYPFSLCFCIMYTMAFIQYSTTFLISLNRFTAIILFRKHSFYWKKYLKIILVFLTVFPFIFTWPIMTNRCYFQYNENQNFFTLVTEADLFLIRYQTLIFMGISTIVSLVLNLTSFIRVSQIKLAEHSYEKNLLFMSAVLFSIQFFGFIVLIIIQYKSFVSSYIYQLAFSCLPYVSDLLTLSPPWLLYIFSSKSRQLTSEMFNSIKSCKSNRQISEPVFYTRGYSTGF